MMMTIATAIRTTPPTIRMMMNNEEPLSSDSGSGGFG